MSESKKISLLLLSTSFIPFLLYFYFSHTNTHKVLHNEIINNLDSIAKAKAARIHDYYHHLKNDVTMLSKAEFIAKSAEDILNYHNEKRSLLPEFKKSSDTFLKTIEPYLSAYDIYNLFLITLQGDIVFSVKNESDYLTNLNNGQFKDTQLAQCFKKALHNHDLTLSKFTFYEPSNQAATFMVEPLIRDGVIIAYIGVQINIERLYEIVQDYSGIGTSGEIILASKEKDKALFINPLRSNKDAAFKYSVQIGAENGKPAQEAVQGKSGSGIYTDYKGTEVLASWRYLNYLELGMVVKQDTSEAFHELQVMKNWGLIIAYFGLLVMLYLVYYIFRLVRNLDDTKQQYEYAIFGTQDGLWDWNLQTNSVYFSPRWKEMLGFKDNELPNDFSSWKDRVHPDDLQPALDAIAKAHNDKNFKFEIIHRLRHKDGSWVWILDRGQTIFDKNEKAIRMVGFHTDITQNEILREDLLQSQKQFEQFMSFIPGNIYIVEDNIMVYMNELNKLFNDFEITTGINIYEMAQGYQEEIFILSYEEALENGVSERVRRISNNGIEKVYRELAFKIEDDEKAKAGFLFIDITSEYEANRQVKRVLSAFERSEISVLMTDIQGNIEYVNPNWCKITGYTKEELLGQNPRIVKSGEISPQEYEKMWNGLTKGNIYSSEIKNKAKDGTEFWEDSTIIPSFNQYGVVDGYIAFKLEINEKMKLRNELRKKDELMIAQSRHAAMGEMISMIAHQWRQPITVIAMNANMILADIDLETIDPVSLKDIATDTIRQTHELSQTIDDFRDFFKPDKKAEEVYMHQVIDDALRVIGKSLEHHGIKINIDNDESLKVITFSRELMQVLINLLKNAKEAFDEKQENKTISIDLFEEDEIIHMSMCDNAGGIELDVLPHIFDPYFTTKGVKNGTGLGLYMSKTIIEKHLKGFIDVYNKNDGVCFEIKIPKSLEDV